MTTKQIKSIPTTYDGVKFRSRLEARWAMFFNLLGWEWHYEYEGFDLDGVWYLPDFWLPKFRYWAEVKPEAFSDEEVIKCIKLAEMTGYEVILLDGPPTVQAYRCVDSQTMIWIKQDSKPLFNKLCDCIVNQYREDEVRFYMATAHARDKVCDIWYGLVSPDDYERFCQIVKKHRFKY